MQPFIRSSGSFRKFPSDGEMLVHVIANDRLNGGLLLLFAQRREFVSIQFNLRFLDSIVIPQYLYLQFQSGSSPAIWICINRYVSSSICSVLLLWLQNDFDAIFILPCSNALIAE